MIMSNETNQNPKLDLQGNYAEKVLSYYLWGTKKAPEPKDIVDEQFVDRPKNVEIEKTDKYANSEIEKVAVKLQIDATEYMNIVGFQAA